MNQRYIVIYSTAGGGLLREASVSAPGPAAAQQHVLASRRDVTSIIDVRPEHPEPNTCPGCGRRFHGDRGLRAHQSKRFISGACRPVKP